MNIDEYISERINSGFIAKDGKPLKCECGCIDFTDFDEYFCQYGREEYAQKCNRCGKTVGRWAFGYWQI